MRETLDGVGISGAEVQQVTDPDLGDNVFQIQSQTLEPGQIKEAENTLEDEYGIEAGRLRKHQRRADLRQDRSPTAPSRR